jgi:hypothetical protein
MTIGLFCANSLLIYGVVLRLRPRPTSQRVAQMSDTAIHCLPVRNSNLKLASQLRRSVAELLFAI